MSEENLSGTGTTEQVNQIHIQLLAIALMKGKLLSTKPIRLTLGVE